MSKLKKSINKNYEFLDGNQVFKLSNDEFGEAYVVVENGEVTFRAGDKVIPILPDVRGEDVYLVEKQDKYDKMTPDELKDELRKRDRDSRLEEVKKELIECQNLSYSVGSFITHDQIDSLKHVKTNLEIFAKLLEEYLELCYYES